MEQRKKREGIVGWTCGAFDLTHAGHYLMFEECKKQCNFLVVGLQTDPSTDRPEKHKPVQSLEERLIQLNACKWIDDIIIYHTEEQLYELLKNIVKPDIRFVGADHKGKPFTGDDLNIKVVYNSRNHNYSSSNLIERVKRSRKLRNRYLCHGDKSAYKHAQMGTEVANFIQPVSKREKTSWFLRIKANYKRILSILKDRISSVFRSSSD